MKYNADLIKRLLNLVAPLRHHMILAIILGTLGHLCAIAIPVLGVSGLLSAIGTTYTGSLPILMFVLLAVCAVMRSLFKYAEQMLNHFVAFKLLALIRSKVFASLRKLAPAKLEVKDKGNLISVITSDIELLEVFYAHTISPVAIAVLVSITMCVFIGVYCGPVLIIPALTAYAVIGILLPSLTSDGEKRDGRRLRDELGELDSYFLDSIEGIQESISYGEGEKRLSRLKGHTEKLFAEQKKLKRSEGRKNAVTGALVMFFSICMLTCSFLLYSSNNMGLNAMMTATVAMMSSFGPVIALSDLSNNLVQVFASANRVFEIIDEEPTVDENETGEGVSGNGFSCDSIGFSYGEDIILNELDLDVQKNTITGLSGKSGSGKSTLLKLLMRFWDVDQGRILISGKDVRDIKTDSLRDLQSYMTQETVLFNETILDNIKIAKPGAAMDEVVLACKKAAVHDFIMGLPDGYETQVGELGDRLSGGERQRIGLARVFLHDGKLILLDEPTSNLDSLNEGQILKSLYECKDEKSIVLVSHRESTLGIADNKIKMEKGRIVDARTR